MVILVRISVEIMVTKLVSLFKYNFSDQNSSKQSNAAFISTAEDN